MADQNMLRIRVNCDAIAPLALAGSPSVGQWVTCQRERGHGGEHRLVVRWDGSVTRIVLNDEKEA